MTSCNTANRWLLLVAVSICIGCQGNLRTAEEPGPSASTKRFVSKKHGISFDVPDGWQPMQKPIGDVAFEGNEDDYLYRFDVSLGSQTLDDAAAEMEMWIDAQWVEISDKLESGSTDIDGHPAQWILTETEHGLYDLTYVTAFDDKRVLLRFNHYNLSLKSDRAHFDKHRKLYEQMVSSFRFE